MIVELDIFRWITNDTKPGVGIRDRVTSGAEIQILRDPGLGPGLRFPGRKNFRDTVPVPCRPLYEDIEI